uniref:RNA-directed DNA polymerase n=1 Tax=Strigamia maritima TaxID=126957 RepID=T1IK73_STRMM
MYLNELKQVKKRFEKGKCFNCGQSGHYRDKCPTARKDKEQTLTPSSEAPKPVLNDLITRLLAKLDLCFICKKKGHESEDCSLLKKLQEGDEDLQGRLLDESSVLKQLVDMTLEEGPSVYESNDSPKAMEVDAPPPALPFAHSDYFDGLKHCLYTLKSVEPHDFALIQIKIENVPVTALMDMGVSSCFIGEQVLAALGIKDGDLKPLKYHYNVAAPGIEHVPIGKVRLAMQWADHVTWFDFIVLKSGVTNVVIGHNFMCKTGLYFKPSGQVCRCYGFPDLVIPYISSKNITPDLMTLQRRRATKQTQNGKSLPSETINQLVDDQETSSDVPIISPLDTAPAEIAASVTWSEELVKGSNCTAEQRQKLNDVLEFFQSIFTDEPGCTDLVEHVIELTGTPRTSPYRISTGLDTAFNWIIRQSSIDCDEAERHLSPLHRLSMAERENKTRNKITLYSALTEALQEVPPTREKIIAAQRADTRLYKIIQFLQNGKFAKDDKNNHDIKSESRGYLMDDDMLVYFVPSDDEELDNSGNGFKAAIPRTLVRRALFACHGHPMSGHCGITKTKYRAKQLYYWKRMSKDVRNYVRSCPHCQQYKPRQQKVTAGEYTPHNMSEPWETVTVDLMGPKPSVILDNCTKYVELFLLSTATGTIVANKLHEVGCRHGFPKKIISDNGPQFISKVYSKYCKRMGVKRSLTSPFNPSANLTKRANRNLKMMLAIFSDVHSHWPRYLNDFAFASRTGISKATSSTPMLLNLGRVIPPSWDPRIIGHVGKLDRNNPQDYINRLLSTIKAATEVMCTLLGILISRLSQNLGHTCSAPQSSKMLWRSLSSHAVGCLKLMTTM